MNKTTFALSVISLMYAVTVQAMDGTELQQGPHTSRCCGFLSSEPTYKPLQDKQEVHVMQGNDAEVVCAAIGKKSLMGSALVPLAEREHFFYGFCAQSEKVTTHLTTELSEKIQQFESEDGDDLSNKLAAMMDQAMIDFYKNNKKACPWAIKDQNIAITFLHMKGSQVCPLTFLCTDEGAFKRINDDPYYTLNPMDEGLLGFSIPTKPSSNKLSSPIYGLLQNNKIAQTVLREQPATLAKRIMETNTNKSMAGCILLRAKQWLERCNCPETTETYKALKQKWNSIPGSILVVTEKITEEILGHRYDSAEELSKFAKDLRGRCVPKKGETPPEDEARLAFLDYMIKQKQAEEASSVTACLKTLVSLLNCTSR